jgi:hypothetical protein
MPTQTPTDRRRALDVLAQRLRDTHMAIRAAWTPDVTAAARSVTDVWPDRLASAAATLDGAFAVYRPLVEDAVPVTDRSRAVKAVEDAANREGGDLLATTTALDAAKDFKTDADKRAIDGARSTMDQSAVALDGWVADFRSFDASVGLPGRPNPPATDSATIETYTVIGNNNPYRAQIRAKIASATDWASAVHRPDKTFGAVALSPFDSVVGRVDLAASATSANVRVAVTLEAHPPLIFSFTYDQAAVMTPSASFQPIVVEAGGTKFVIMQSAQINSAGAPQLIVCFAEDRGA